jgi:hypothetical protein
MKPTLTNEAQRYTLRLHPLISMDSVLKRWGASFQEMFMKLTTVILAALMTALISGCIIVPEHDHHGPRWHDRGGYGYYDRGGHDHDYYRR